MDNTVSSQPHSQPEPEPTSPVNTDNPPSPSPTTLPGPQGIGMAVAFDWGLTAQLLVAPLLPLVVQVSSSRPGVIGSGSIALSFLAALPFAALIAVFGEGVRRGWRWTRLVQVVVKFSRLSRWSDLAHSSLAVSPHRSLLAPGDLGDPARLLASHCLASEPSPNR